MKSFFITGGAGFIGSHVCEEIVKKFPKAKIFVLDKLTYAGNIKFIKNLISTKQIKFIKADLIDIKKYSKYLKKIDCAINVAAESHVDNSFTNSINFTKTNVLGTHTFIQGCINNNIKKIIHISTDEVYGDKIKGKSKETDKLNPTNPYSASKAAAEMIINSYKFVHKKNIIIVRANNIYGIRQYPEKLIPSCITNLLKNEKINIHGNGKNIRHFLSVNDFCKALILIIKKVNIGVFNVGCNQKYKNIDVAKKISLLMNETNKIRYVKDRPFNDTRYSITSKKLNKLGWKPREELFLMLPQIISWYKNNKKIFKKVN
jgi:dTDP-glucose 4,6-dehydratase